MTGVQTCALPISGEMARFLGISVEAVQKQRRGIASKIAKEFKVVVVLKGHKTVVASPMGALYLNPTGNPGMATAGMGDVLTGMIAALIGQGLEPYVAAKVGVYLHGLSGDLASHRVGQVSLLASDVVEAIPSSFYHIGHRRD